VSSLEEAGDRFVKLRQPTGEVCEEAFEELPEIARGSRLRKQKQDYGAPRCRVRWAAALAVALRGHVHSMIAAGEGPGKVTFPFRDRLSYCVG
jgi:hypothetical protein